MFLKKIWFPFFDSFTLHFKVLFMNTNDKEHSIEELKHIRKVMDRSARFLSLSGWSGVWAGVVALAGAAAAHKILKVYYQSVGGLNAGFNLNIESYAICVCRLLILSILIFVVAFIGAFIFTYIKNKKENIPIWNPASKKLLISLALSIGVGAVFCLGLLRQNDIQYIVPVMLLVYGFALINSSRYTLTDVRYLGCCEVVLACVCLFYPQYSLWFCAAGFGVLHIIYGFIMWNKYKG